MARSHVPNLVLALALALALVLVLVLALALATAPALARTPAPDRARAGGAPQAAPAPAPDEPPRPRSAAFKVLGGEASLTALRQALLRAPPDSPERTRLKVALGIAEALSGHPDKAVELLADAVSGAGDLARAASYYLGLARLDLGDPAGAARALAEAADRPGDGALGPDAAYMAGVCLARTGRPAEALARFEKRLQGPRDAFYPRALLAAAQAAEAAGRPDRAADYAARLLSDHPAAETAGEAETLARRLFAAGLSPLDPDDPRMLLIRAETLVDKRQSAKAEALIARLRALPGPPEEARLLYLLGKARYDQRKNAESLALFTEVASRFPDSSIAPWARYHAARALWRSTTEPEARRMEELLRQVTGDTGADIRAREVAGRHLTLLLLERGRLAEAERAALDQLGLGLAGEIADQAAYLSGLLALAGGRPSEAAARLGGLASARPPGDFADGAAYFLARALDRTGDAAAAAAWRDHLATTRTNTYYGRLAAEALAGTVRAGAGQIDRVADAATAQTVQAGADQAGRATGAALAQTVQAGTDQAGRATGSAPSAATPSPPPAPPPPRCPDPAMATDPDPEVAARLALAAFLEHRFLPDLAEMELARLAARHPDSGPAALAHVELAGRLGRESAAAATAWRTFGSCLTRGRPAAFGPLGRALYPRRHEAAVKKALGESGVDPNVILALIRQESFFNPRAVSPAGAVGLMQLLPATAREEARKLGLKFKESDLSDPEVNVGLGVAHFLGRLARYGTLAATLASYNAGSARVDLWLTHLGPLGEELFIEFLPYAETRDYVRRILANVAMYGHLYQAGPSRTPGGGT